MPNTPMKIRVGANVQSAKLIRKVDPVYPAQARAEGIEGSVTLQVTIGEDGQVQSAEPIEGNPILAAAAQEAVKQWGYQPTLLNGRPCYRDHHGGCAIPGELTSTTRKERTRSCPKGEGPNRDPPSPEIVTWRQWLPPNRRGKRPIIFAALCRC